MARCSEVVRQWEILRDIDAARSGIAVGKLAAERGVCDRTIRRDLEALARAGFPIYDDKVNGTSMWKLRAKPFARLEETGLSVMEMCALYFSRTMMDILAGTPLAADAERAFVKIERALPAGCRKFIDQLPRLLTAKSGGRKKHDERKLREILSRALDATLLHRRATMRYASMSSRQTKDYLVEPQRIAYVDGGIYLVAWVVDYDEMRNFAAERIQTFAVTDETFQPRALPVEPFPHSLGVNSGVPEEVVIEFEPRAAVFVREREWHRSQQLEDRTDGGVVLKLTVCNDWSLRAWILGFGPDAHVVSPVSLARDVFDAVSDTRRRYLRAQSPLAVLAMRAG
jgi:predicted DNA-binding transcriptional regulator YafY